MADELLCQPSDVADAWANWTTLSATRQTSLIARASQKVHNHCRRTFAATGYTEVHDGPAAGRLWLRNRPILSVSTVTINGVALDNSLGDAWTFEPRKGYIVRGNGQDDSRFTPWFPRGDQNITVQYWAGFSAVPDPVIEATVLTVEWLWGLNQQGGSGMMKSETIGTYKYERADQVLSSGLPPHIASLLCEYVQDDAFA